VPPSQRRTQPVYEITGVAAGREADLRSRMRRYTIGMTLRTICFVGAVLAQGWLRWTFVAGALVLPYVAVLIANAGRESGGRRGDRVLPPIPAAPAPELPAAPSPRVADRDEARHREDMRHAEPTAERPQDEPAEDPEHATPAPSATHAA
jgi:hypothetical protein